MHSILFVFPDFQHYLHHAKSIKNKPYHTGFFLQLWDRLFGSVFDGDCLCAKCARDNNQRDAKAFETVIKPDYSVLWQPSFWQKTFAKETEYFTKLSSLPNQK